MGMPRRRDPSGPTACQAMPARRTLRQWVRTTPQPRLSPDSRSWSKWAQRTRPISASSVRTAMSVLPARRPTGRRQRRTCRNSPVRLEALEVLRPVAQQEARARAGARRAVTGIVELALGKRQAAAAYATVQQLAGFLQHRDARLQRTADAPA